MLLNPPKCMDGARMQVALIGPEDVEEWVALPTRSWRFKAEIPVITEQTSVDDRIASAFFVAMGLVGVALIALTVKIARTKKK